MSSVLPYKPANSPDSKKEWGWRDGLCLSIGVALLLPLIPGPSMMAKRAFAQGEFLYSFFWSLGTMIILTLGIMFFLVGITHEAKTGIRKFFRDRPNLLGFASMGGVLASIGLTIQLISLAILMFQDDATFVAMNYVSGAVFFAVAFIYCTRSVINWALEILGGTSDDYIQAAKGGDPHDF